MKSVYPKRVAALASKYYRLQLKSLSFTSLYGRLVGPKILMNSIPKAGTNLLEQALSQFPLLHRSSFRTLRGWNSVDASTLVKIHRLKPGAVVAAHLPAHSDLLDALEESDVKVLLMVRDPRDQLVSYVNYVTRMDFTHPAHKYFANLPNDSVRLLAAINGVEGIKSPASEMLERFSGWLQSDAMIVRFEDLIGSKGGGSDVKQLEVVVEIANFIGIELSHEQALRVCDAIYAPTALTFRAPQINGWRSSFKDEHIAALSAQCGDLMRQYGYEVEM